MVEIDTYIRLNNPLFREHFSQTPKWQEHYLYAGQFQHVTLWFSQMNERGEYAKLFFDNSIAKVTEIERDEQGKPLFVRTELFWIHYPAALEAGEIEILSEPPKERKGFEEDQKTIEDLEFYEIEARKGLFQVLERENNKHYAYSKGFHFMRKAGKWDD